MVGIENITHMDAFNAYISEICEVQDDLEHSGRTFLQKFLNTFAAENKIEIKHEPKRDKDGRGAPDFKFLLNDTEIGYLENKKIGEDLDKVLKSTQVAKYKTLTDNLIITDYLRWIWVYKDEVIKDVRICEKTALEHKKVKLNTQNINEVGDLINDFLSQKPQEIVKARDLAEKLARPTRTIKAEINDILKASESNNNSRIVGTFGVFKTEISENITPEDFADAFAQTLTYSLFLTKITLTSSEKLTLSNIAHLTPKSFALIRDILAFINEIENYPQIKPFIERIFHIINHTNAFEVVTDLRNNKDEFEDPYIHFYENFLTAYDKNKRKDLGVWYTPKPVVRSIIDNIHEILKADFNLEDGLADESVKLLDFACGTGTFLFEVYEKILSQISQNSLKRAGLIKNHILKNIFGFELLIPAYCVSHLKLSQYLKDKNYELQNDDRIRVYFTNTLENRQPDKQASLYQNFFPSIAKEGREAQEIKDDKSILVITGNPPYNAKSKNILEGELLKFHKGYKCDDETNSKSIQDSYVKFIAFAHRKIKLAGRGVFGIIVNNSFLSGLTHRKMRNELMKDFDKIYIINLHGGGEINGIKDENVFEIKQNVCIAIFVKNDTIKDKGVFQTDLIGKRLEKFKALSELKLQFYTDLNPPLEGGSAAKQSGRGYNTQNLKFAKEMRKEMTKEEFRLWNVLKSQQLGYKFRRQHLIGNFITDFCCLEKKLVIELDGSQHTEQEKYDNQRTAFLNSCGFKVIRFWNNEFIKHFDASIDYIVSVLEDKTPPVISYGNYTLPQGAGCSTWQKLEINEFNKAFKSTNWGKNRFKDNLSFFYPMKEAKAMLEYGKFVGLTDIFMEYTSGIKTADDKNLISFKEDEFKKKIDNFDKQFIQNISYRPFDNRKIYYDTKLVERPRLAIMPHMLKDDNVGLIFRRTSEESDGWFNIMTTNSMADINSLEAQTYLAPLYLHKNDLEGEGKEANFKPEFLRMITQKFAQIDRYSAGNANATSQNLQTNSTLPPGEGYSTREFNELSTPEEGSSTQYDTPTFNPPLEGGSYTQYTGRGYIPTPEEILAYIYSVLHSPSYRTKYLEFLKIDFPRINFDVSPEEFKRLSGIGQGLIDAHLMKKIPQSKIGEPEFDGAPNYIMEKVEYAEATKRLYFNKTCYFADVSPAVWEFKIGGYQVLDKYLKSRKGMDISSDLGHVQNIIKVLDFTVSQMDLIDKGADI